MFIRNFILILIAVLFVSCAGVTLTPQGKKARVLDSADVAHCQGLGNATTSVMSHLGIIKRQSIDVENELSISARNAAADMGGDTVVPITPVQDGKRTYAIYKCVGTYVK